ncbi:MAG: hydantoinase/oxoprolinase family protein [Pseudomonadota bacterium]
MKARLSVDIGGTFTDVALLQALSDGPSELTTTKVLTTYDDPARGVMQGIDDVLLQAGVAPESIDLVLHGTTLATNALIERRGAVTGLLTTAGHRDVLEMAFENRFEQYDVNIERAAPLVPRYLRLGITERVAADGTTLIPMAEAEVLEAARELVDAGVTSLAIGFLHSYAQPEHEQRARDLLVGVFPQLSLTLSSEVCPEIREYERLSTTVANAYVKPLMSQYLASLAEQLTAFGIPGQVLMMTSGGGLTTLEAASAYPVRLVESGPAGGAMLAAHLARQHDLAEVLSFDMGGTTAKICLIDQGEPLHSRAFEVDRRYRFKKGSGLPVRIPVIEMVEIGAGGGSIAHMDELQRLLIGPESAGSEPGPACYGRGGEAATVTDADVVLGKVPPDLFAGGKLRLQTDAAERAVQTAVAAPLNLSVQSAAHAVAEVVEENMAAAARAHAAEWGRDLQARCMIAFGGAAPLHAAQLASKLKIGQVLIPHGAGVGSALGFLLSPVRFEVVRSLYMRLDSLDTERLEHVFADMRAEAAQVLSGAGVDTYSEHSQAYMRYVGQGYEVAVELPGNLSAAALLEGFERSYVALYGRTIPGMAVEVLSWTLALSATTQSPRLGGGPVSAEKSSARSEVPEPLGYTDYFGGETQIRIPIYARDALNTQMRLTGPLLVVEAQTTTVVPEAMELRVLDDGAMSMTATEER